MDKFIEMLKQELQSMSANRLIRVARAEFGIEDFEDYTREELIEQCLRVETENAYH
jgi:hypothetical protein